MQSSPEPVTVFLPVLNGGERLERVLTAIRGQRTQRQVHLRAIDSGSSDGSRDVLARHGVQFREIWKREYDHGLTRNCGVLECPTELIALLSQDALPANPDWLENLLAPFEDPLVAGTWARQVPQPACHPYQRINLSAHMAAAQANRVTEPLSPTEWAALEPSDRMRILVFDNVSSAVRKSVIRRHPFPKSMFGEDVEWARTVLLHGYRLVFAANAVVEHSHDVNVVEFSTRVAQTHQVRRRLTDHDPIPTLQDFVVRLGQTTEAFRKACREAVDLPEDFRRHWEGCANLWAMCQIQAAYQGAKQATYDPPRG
ncbi:MAG: glycosyltransferase family 2 protein [Planctomycetaceae bacterium]|nr:glycosyltransferase family 2 protein [Planctomycetaceae bacterium]